MSATHEIWEKLLSPERLGAGAAPGTPERTAYQQDYGQYQDYLSRLDTLYGNYAAQEQEAAAQKQQRFNNAVTVLGLIGDAVQIALSGTTGLGSLAGSLVNTGYNIYANNRAYEADRADTAPKRPFVGSAASDRNPPIASYDVRRWHTCLQRSASPSLL